MNSHTSTNPLTSSSSPTTTSNNITTSPSHPTAGIMTSSTPLLKDSHSTTPSSSNKILLQENHLKIYYKSSQIHLLVTTEEVILFKHGSTVTNDVEDGGLLPTENNNKNVLLRFSHTDLIGGTYKLLQKRQGGGGGGGGGGKKEMNTVHQFSLHYYPVKKTSCFTSCCCSGGSNQEKQRYYNEVKLYVYNTEEERLDQWKEIFYRVAIPPDYDNPNPSSYTGSTLIPSTLLPSSTTTTTTTSTLPSSTSPTNNKKAVLVFVNPVSGKRVALKMYRTYVEPMLQQANMKIELIITTHAFHAKEYVMAAEGMKLVENYSTILTVGGDGILFEVINGIALRSSGDGMAILQQLPIVPIPGGTGNGISKSILFMIQEDPSPLNAVFNVIKGKSYPMDLSQVITEKDGKTHYAFLMLSWGIISDIDIHSERLRFLGDLRLTLYGIYFAFARRIYHGKLKMKLVTTPTITDPKILKSKVSINKILPSDTILEDGWVLLDADFTMVSIVQTSHLATSVYFGPGVRLDDGVFTVYVGHRLSHLQLANVLLSMDSGGHIYSQAIRIFQCTEYILEPVSMNGIYSLDGEVVEYGTIHGTVLPSAARVRLIQPPGGVEK